MSPFSGVRYRFAAAAVCAASVFLAGCPGNSSKTADTTPPSAPTGLGATAASGAQINLAWTAATDDVGVTGYFVERCQGASCSGFAQIATPGATNYSDTGLTDATSYSYRVRATDAAGNLGAYSGTASATTLDATPPSAPSSLSATPANQTQINLTWNAATDNVGVTGYRVERCQGASCTGFAQIATPTATNFNDTGLTAGTSYSYQVRAVDAAGNLGSYTSVASATTLPNAPVAPSGVTATPGNTQVTLSWGTVAGATSYNVYSSLTDPVTVSGTQTSVLVTGATLSSLTNGTPIYAAVTAVNAGGESPLSQQVCGVPTASTTTGLTLYDPLCEKTLDGQKWSSAMNSTSVSGAGALVMRTAVSNMESRTIRGKIYSTTATVNAAGQRVSTLQTDVNVPSATAARTGTADARAILQISYQPPLTRLNFPGGNQDLLFIGIGLADSGSGLHVVRRIQHQDNPDGTLRSTTGISFVDPLGFSPSANGQEVEATASYDTTYTISASLDEATGVLSWSVAGGAFGGGVSGTADPSAYLAGNTNWSALGANPLAGAGFSAAFLRTQLADTTVAAGSDGDLTASFDNVQVGFNNAAATLYDDFGGTAPNSGPNELSSAKWTQPGGATGGRNSTLLTAGKLAAHVQGTSANSSGFRNFQGLNFDDPPSVNTMQANVTVTSCTNPYTGIKFNEVGLSGSFFNDGTTGAPPNNNQANSNVGDVRANLIIDCTTNLATISITRFITQTTTTLVGATGFGLGTAVTGNNHKLKLAWDPAAHSFTFQVDNGTPVVVDPTTASAIVTTPTTVVGPANTQFKQIFWGVSVGNNTTDPTGVSASMDLTVSNVFTAP